MSDTRPYFFCQKEDNGIIGWCFIAAGGDFVSKIIPLETWKTNDKTYTFNRIAYSKGSAAQLINKSSSGNMNSYDGPELYAVYDLIDKTNYAVIYKPGVSGCLEIQCYKSNNSALLKENITVNEIKDQFMKMME